MTLSHPAFIAKVGKGPFYGANSTVGLVFGQYLCYRVHNYGVRNYRVRGQNYRPVTGLIAL